MKGFYIVTAALIASVFACGLSFTSQNTTMVFVLFLGFIPALWVHGFMFGRKLDIQITPRDHVQQQYQQPVAQQRPVPASRLRQQTEMDARQ